MKRPKGFQNFTDEPLKMEPSAEIIAEEMEPSAGAPAPFTWTGKIARFISKNSLICLLGSLSACIAALIVTVTIGNLEITVDSYKGFKSRGTLIGKRAMQASLVRWYQEDLFYDDFRSNSLSQGGDLYSSPWDYMQENVILGYHPMASAPSTEEGRRLLQRQTCDSSWYGQADLANDNYLFAVWKTDAKKDNPTSSILEPPVLLELCEAEDQTKQSLGQNGLCGACQDAECLPPYSLLLLIRNAFDGFDMSCQELIEAYTPVEEQFTQILVACANNLREFVQTASENVTSCPLVGFGPHLVDRNFGLDGNIMLRYSSSYFYDSNSHGKEKLLYEISDSFGRGGSILTGAYDTIYENLNAYAVNDVIKTDMVRSS